MPEFKREQAQRIESTYGSAVSRGYDHEWVRLRREVLGASPVCQCGARASLVHHIRPIKSGGNRLDPANCEAVCARCHQLRHRGKHASAT